MFDIKTTFDNVEKSGLDKDKPLDFPISNTDVTKAGQTIRSYMNNKDLEGRSEEGFLNALLVLRKYRENHAPCLKIFSNLLSEKLKRLNFDKKSIVSSRTKRLESISVKLTELSSTRLSQIEDIVGVRVTLPNMNALNTFVSDINGCEIRNSEHNEGMLKEHDYINKPKSDGYRGIHQIFKFKNNNKSFRIELQIRTKLQHEWATTVEVLSYLYKSNFKKGLGNKNCLEFLRLTSALFSIEEKSPVLDEFQEYGSSKICIELKKLSNRLDIIGEMEKPSAFTQDNESKKAKYYLVQLDLVSYRTSILAYADGKKANDDYYRLEKDHHNRFDTVLVSVDNMDKIKDAYPNYFLNSDEFINRYYQLMAKYG